MSFCVCVCAPFVLVFSCSCLFVQWEHFCWIWWWWWRLQLWRDEMMTRQEVHVALLHPLLLLFFSFSCWQNKDTVIICLLHVAFVILIVVLTCDDIFCIFSFVIIYEKSQAVYIQDEMCPSDSQSFSLPVFSSWLFSWFWLWLWKKMPFYVDIKCTKNFGFCFLAFYQQSFIFSGRRRKHLFWRLTEYSTKSNIESMHN